MAWGPFLSHIVKPGLEELAQFNPTKVIKHILCVLLPGGAFDLCLSPALSMASLAASSRLRVSPPKVPLHKHRLH